MKEIILNKFKGKQGFVALVDDCDFDWLNQWNWSCQKHFKTYYAFRKEINNNQKKDIKMHRLIMDAQPGEQLDHDNGNGLHNYRSNLRFSTQTQNCQNRHHTRGKSIYKGVAIYNGKSPKKWRGQIQINGKKKHLGLFYTEIAAATAYNEAASVYFKEFARLNPI